MRISSTVFRATALVLSVCCGIALTACSTSDDVVLKKKKRPALPGEEDSELSWSRPTSANEVATPMGLPMSR